MFYWRLAIYIFITSVIAFLLLFSLGLVEFPSAVRPDLNKIAAGCYSNDQNKEEFILINANGKMKFNDFSANYHIEFIKGNYYLLPSYSIVYNEKINKLIKRENNPYFFKYTDSKMNEFEVNTSQGDSVVIFSKLSDVNCRGLAHS